MSKKFTPIVAAVALVIAGGAAYWFQNKPASKDAAADKPLASSTAPAATPSGGAPAPAVGASGAAATVGGSTPPARPAGVEVGKIEITKLTDDAQTVGSLRSRQGVMVRPEVSARVRELNFKDGERVRKGQLLVQFDDQLQQAQLRQADAELGIARANHKRNEELLAQNFISKRSVDESAANVEVAQAKRELAKATADRLKILSPFDGVTGIRLVNPGDYLKDGADIVNIEDMDAIFVDFKLPERFQTKVRKGQKADVQLDALPGRKFEALVQAVDPLIDANGRAISVRACIDNRSMQLRPGMFARVTQVFGERDKALVLPEEAIVPFGPRTFVFKVVDGKTLDDKGQVQKVSERVEVKIGIRRPGKVEITEGVKPDDVIVIAGQQRLGQGGGMVRVIESARPQGGGPPGAGGAPNPTGGAPNPPAGAASAPVAGGSAPQANAGAPSSARPSAGQAGKAPPARPVQGQGSQGLNPCLAEAGSVPASGVGQQGGARPAGAPAAVGNGKRGG